MTEPDARPLGTTTATALVVANMVGTGIFTTTGFMAESIANPLIILGIWAVGGVLALCGASVYGELGAMMPHAGGEYVYLRRAFGPAVGFLSGFVSLVVGFSAPIAAAAYGFGAYLHSAVPGVPLMVAAVSVIVLTTLLHMADVVWGGRIQTLLSAYKVLVILAFVGAAFTVGDGDLGHLTGEPVLAAPPDIAVALVLVAFAYSGWNAAAYVAGELRDPGRTLPRSLLLGTGAVLALYLALNLAFFYAAPTATLAASPEDVGAVAARALFGGAGDAFALAIAFALVSSVSAMVLAGPRVYMAMARDGVFFRVLGRTNRRGAPYAAVALQGVIAIVVVVTASFGALLTWIGFTLSLFAALTVVGAFVLRRREPGAPRPYRALFWPVTPLLFLALSVWMVVFSIRAEPLVAAAGAGTLAAGLLFHLVWRRLR